MKMTKEHSATQSSQSPTGLVLEGGGLRAMFTSGVLDVFMQNDIRFDAAVGVSAGVLFGCNYKSNQPGRALRYNIRFKDNPEYMSWKSLFEPATTSTSASPTTCCRTFTIRWTSMHTKRTL